MAPDNKQTYSQKVNEWLVQKSGRNLQEYCRYFGYYPLAIKIMGLDENDEKKSKKIIGGDRELKEHYLKYAKDPKSISRKGENRSWTQYFKDLITGWVIEDLVIEMMRKQGIEVHHNGRDAERVIDIGSNVNQQADIEITVGEISRKVELTNEFNTILMKHGFIEKRAPALVNLWKEKGIWLYRDISNGKYVLIDFATENITLHLRHHNTVSSTWTKDVHRYILEEHGKKIRDDRMLAAELISVVGCSIEGKVQPELKEVVDEDSPPVKFELGGHFKTQKESVPIGKKEEGKPKEKSISKEKTKAEKNIIKAEKNERVPAVAESEQQSKVKEEEHEVLAAETDYDVEYDELDNSSEGMEEFTAVVMGDEDFL